MLGESGSKPNKIWVSKGGTFYNKTIQFNTHEKEYVVTKIFIRTLKKKTTNK